ncbi:hypothetical protein Gohar_010560 [Gossypium harknessii]|uniref:Uncharacterized protein n=1 Tax=Gossypium harknessii TaxID=34285 RepID=A0A7J9GRE4_9ROSI|nr:hypothetical protein [Gossypium harknessii]
MPTLEFMVGGNPLGSNSGVGKVMNKVRRWSDLPLDLDDPTVDVNGLNQSVGMEEDLEFLDGDVVTKMVDGIPSITFSDRVHKYIKRKMHRGKGQNTGAVKGDNHYVKARGSHFSVLNEDMGGDDTVTIVPIEGGLGSGVKG